MSRFLSLAAMAAALLGQTSAGPPTADTGPSPMRAVEPTPRGSVSPSAPVPGLGPRIAARIRRAPPEQKLRFLARGVDPVTVRAEGGRITAQIGPVQSGWAPAEALPRLARGAIFLEAPKRLRPALDVSRRRVRADVADFATEFESTHRGGGALIAAYDTGVDLTHPDLRDLDGPTRVLALWDQSRLGTPPEGQSYGHECDRASLLADTCPHRDPVGHGTTVLGVAASGGPRYRGVAPEAALLVASSDDFEGLLDALVWFDAQAQSVGRPMVVNLSLSGQEGPHDGTSLESQALDALGHPVVVAAGNEGDIAVHALARLEKGDERQFVLRFPTTSVPPTRRASVDIWGDVGLPLTARVTLTRPGGQVTAQTRTVSPGEAGGTEALLVGTATVGWVDLDAEAAPNPFNGQAHIRLGLELAGWEDDPDGLGYVTVGIRGEGRVDLWVDSPASESSPVRFDRDRVLEIEDQALGDFDHTLSDLACSADVLVVSASVVRKEFEDADGNTRVSGGVLDTISGFSAWGPTLSPSTTGEKPDLAAPGQLIISAQSADAPRDASTTVSALYRASAGTSLACAHVSGAAAVLLGARPDLDPAAVRQTLRRSTSDAPDEDSRWGAGRLDVAAALTEAGIAGARCRCVSTSEIQRSAGLWMLVVVVFGVVRKRRLG